MKNYYYVHTDFFNYLSFNVKKLKSFENNEKNVNKYLHQMLDELNEISNGNLIIPTYNYDFGEKKVFDMINDKSHVGTFSEFFRKKFCKKRTKVPFFSSCCSKKLPYYNSIEEMIDPFGKVSDFHFLKENNGKILNFGSTFAPTFIIFIERFIPNGPLYRYEKKFFGKIIDGNNQTKISLIYIVRPKGINISYNLKKIKKDLIQKEILKIKKTKNNFIYEECDAKDFFNFSLEKIKKNPLYFLSDETINFLNINNILGKGRVKIENFEK